MAKKKGKPAELRDEQKSCQCKKCSAACSWKPGWFLPGEAEKAAEFMKMHIKDFFKKYLAVDWWNGKNPGEETFLLAPALQHHTPGTEYPVQPVGTCIFFNNKRCAIHGAKPYECVQYWHGDKTGSGRHKEVAMSWTDNQGQIEELLGRKPVATMPNVGDMLEMMLGVLG